MKPTNKTTAILLAATGLAALAFALTQVPTTAQSSPTTPTTTPTTVEPTTPSTPEQKGSVQIALLLDTSSSMSGLIDQAKTQLWKIVNELAASERHGHNPRLEIALYEYGKSTLNAENGFIRQIVPLTDDLDRVSEALFALNTNGGDEYAGQVIQSAVRELGWSAREDALQLIFIAGNEAFNQGPIDHREAIAEARASGIVVNTIYCGSDSDPVGAGWQQGAALAHGRSLFIDHNHVEVHIAAPQDDEIARLGAELNATYIGYSAGWSKRMDRQAAEDGNASQSGSMVARSQSKASAMYSNAGWDLVDGLRDGTITWDKVDEGNLSDEMRAMSQKEREAFVGQKRVERERIQKHIRELSSERQAFVSKKRREMADSGKSTLDTAMIEMIREQAGSKGYSFE